MPRDRGPVSSRREVEWTTDGRSELSGSIHSFVPIHEPHYASLIVTLADLPPLRWTAHVARSASSRASIRPQTRHEVARRCLKMVEEAQAHPHRRTLANPQRRSVASSLITSSHPTHSNYLPTTAAHGLWHALQLQRPRAHPLAQGRPCTPRSPAA